jgi:hypothetical protein
VTVSGVKAAVRRAASSCAGAIAKQSRRGWRIDRPNPRVAIDGITALLMALDRLENRPTGAYVIGRDCALCGRPAEHLDHVPRLARGATDHPSNLQPL